MDNCLFIVFGITGDLAKRKIIPALYALVRNNKLQNFFILGAANDEISPHDIFARARQYVTALDEEVWQKLQTQFEYSVVNFDAKGDFTALAKKIEAIENEHKLSGNRLAYLATPPDYFCTITDMLGSCGIMKRYTQQEKSWHRIVYEKPFGLDVASAHHINQCISKWFDEKQIFRIDHYLTKELIGDLVLIRFTNIIFEPLWNNKYIDYVEITLSEKIGIEGRGHYYDKYGVIKDVIQNHMLQILALVCMERPDDLTGDRIRDKKVEVLKKVQVAQVVQGQYEGYRQERGVSTDSLTPTFAAISLRVDAPRWKDVPFYLIAGKKLDHKYTLVEIHFKDIACPLMGNAPCYANSLKIEISTEADFSINLNVKAPGRTYEVKQVSMNFCHSCMFGPSTPAAYELIFEQVMAGDPAVSVRFDEIEYAWNIYDQIAQKAGKLIPYAPGSSGPQVPFNKSTKETV